MSKGYATVSNIGMDYRQIAKKMTESGHPMNHSSARNYVIRTMHKFAAEVIKMYDPEGSLNRERIDIISKDPRFQESMEIILSKIYD